MALVILIHVLVFLAFWLTNLPYEETLNNFLIAATGRRVNFLLIFMVFAGLVALWSTARLALPCHGHFLSSLLLQQFRRFVSEEPGPALPTGAVVPVFPAHR